jgi:uncharacterized membrane-anchored protein YitT (DUF2179 family)
MNPIITQEIMRRLRRARAERRGARTRAGVPSTDEGAHGVRGKLAKALRSNAGQALRGFLTQGLLLTAGVVSAGFGLKGFLLPNNFIDGGAVGISLLTAEVTGWSLSVLIVCVNIPFIVMGAHTLGRGFALRTALAIAALALAVQFVPYPQITSDRLLVAVFGGFFLGAGIGLAVRGGGVIDGTEVLAIAVGKRLGVTMGDVILGINILIFSVGAWLLSVETVLYSMLTYLAASKTVDFVVEGIEEYIGVTIISPFPDEIRRMIIDRLGRGVTIYKGERGFGSHGEATRDLRIVFTVMTRLEIGRLKTEIARIDPDAFVVMHGVKDTRGGMIKKRPLKG